MKIKFFYKNDQYYYKIKRHWGFIDKRQYIFIYKKSRDNFFFYPKYKFVTKHVLLSCGIKDMLSIAMKHFEEKLTSKPNTIFIDCNDTFIEWNTNTEN